MPPICKMWWSSGLSQQQYFAELAQFLTHANRNLGLVDEGSNVMKVSVNIVERLQVCNVSHSTGYITMVSVV